MKVNNKIRKGLSFLVLTALIATGIYTCPPAYAAEIPNKKVSDETYYHLDMGVQVTYTGPEWKLKGLNYGYQKSGLTATVAFPQDVEVLDAYPLNSTQGQKFDFDGPTSSTNIPQTLQDSTGSSTEPAKAAYEQSYANYVATSMTASGTPTANGNKITFSYNALMKTNVLFDVVKYGIAAKLNGDSAYTSQYYADVWKPFGGKDAVSNAGVKSAIENAYIQGYNGTAGTNRMYLVFCPTVIEYKKVAEVPVTTPGGIDPGTTSGGGIDGNTPGLIDPGDITTPDAPETSAKVHKLALSSRGLTGSCKDSASRQNHVGESDSAFQYWKITVKLSEYDKSGHPIVTTLQNNNIQKGSSAKFTVTFPRVGTYKVYGSRWWYCESQGMHTHYKTDSQGHKTKHCSFLQYAGGGVIEQHGGVGPYWVVITPTEVNVPISFDENWEQTPVGTDTVMIL